MERSPLMVMLRNTLNLAASIDTVRSLRVKESSVTTGRLGLKTVKFKMAKVITRIIWAHRTSMHIFLLLLCLRAYLQSATLYLLSGVDSISICKILLLLLISSLILIVHGKMIEQYYYL